MENKSITITNTLLPVTEIKILKFYPFDSGDYEVMPGGVAITYTEDENIRHAFVKEYAQNWDKEKRYRAYLYGYFCTSRKVSVMFEAEEKEIKSDFLHGDIKYIFDIDERNATDFVEYRNKDILNHITLSRYGKDAALKITEKVQQSPEEKSLLLKNGVVLFREEYILVSTL